MKAYQQAEPAGQNLPIRRRESGKRSRHMQVAGSFPISNPVPGASAILPLGFAFISGGMLWAVDPPHDNDVRRVWGSLANGVSAAIREQFVIVKLAPASKCIERGRDRCTV